MKIQCICGELIYRTEFPSRERFRVYGDIELDRIIERILAIRDKSVASPAEFADEVDDVFFSSTEQRVNAIECPHCGRLLVMVGPYLKMAYRREEHVDPQGGLAKLPSLFDLFRELSPDRASSDEKSTDSAC